MRGSLTTLRAWNRSLTKASDKLWKSPGTRTSMDWTCIFNPTAASWLSFQLAALLIFFGFHRTATRESLGTVSLRSSRRFPLNSGDSMANPVMLPPGRSRLAISPLPTGSALAAITIGIVLVAFLTDSIAGVDEVTITSTLSCTARPQGKGNVQTLPPQTDIRSRYSLPQRSRVLADPAGMP